MLFEVPLPDNEMVKPSEVLVKRRSTADKPTPGELSLVGITRDCRGFGRFNYSFYAAELAANVAPFRSRSKGF